MARKKNPAPAPEATTTTTAQQEAHLDPGQLADMDDATLQQLAQDMGLDPATYENRDALTAAIAEVPVTPGPPEAKEQGDAQEKPQEGHQEQSDAQQGQDTATAQEGQQDAQEQPKEAQEPVPITDRPLPCKAEVAASIAVLRRAVIGTAEMVRPVATLDKGTAVTVIAFEGDYARLANGLYVKTTLLA